jgi:Uncharacterized protein conserved in bacteria (DUF2059)
VRSAERKAANIASGLAAAVCFLLSSVVAPAAPPPAKAPLSVRQMTPFNVGPIIQPTDDPAKVEAARQFILVYHPHIDPKNVNKMLDEYIPRLIAATKKVNPKLDEKKFAQERRATILSGAAQSLVNQSHVVSRHFTLQELKNLTAFYGSPLGRKIVEESPRITQEMRMAHQMERMAKPGDKDNDDDDDDAKPSSKGAAQASTATPAKPPAASHK